MTGAKRFPEGFVWGAATSAYQIEGALERDGRSESIWDRFAARGTTIIDGSSGAGACDHYHRFPADIEIMRWMGLHAYRFSIAWPRVLPNGRGRVGNAKGIAFYDRLVDGLLERGIRPFATLYHWDLPQVLEDQGGWPERATAEAFVDYTDVITRALGDRVKDWITHNEPWCVSVLGYADGIHAPGRKSWPDALRAAHHLLLSHGWAMPVIRANVPEARAGITLNFVPAQPASNSAADLEATREFDGRFNRWFVEPLFGLGYPADVVRDHENEGRLPESGMAFVREGDLEAMAAPMDFLGVNYYSRGVIRSTKLPEAENHAPLLRVSDDKTDLGWEIYPSGLSDLLLSLHEKYKPKALYVTENGAACRVAPDDTGGVPDAMRVRYLDGHLRACASACQRGVPLLGYFVWSLLDNYEWAEGYTQRFGVVWVDYETQQRIPKQSAHWYRSVIAENALPGQ